MMLVSVSNLFLKVNRIAWRNLLADPGMVNANWAKSTNESAYGLDMKVVSPISKPNCNKARLARHDADTGRQQI
ncbi:hypothetical protein [Mesorhizobium sp. NFR06]|uniref:hypothetical protein n=1 Tax=Mesorhizobium sp. NFR06 TaxID=1566290 RepID=UPI00122DAE69|nr:hypothetical protein [Mesorhizobium sp. NFR06]